jgi:hypothetical protein
MSRLVSLGACLSLIVGLGCGPGLPDHDDTQASAGAPGDGDPGDGDGEGAPGDGDPGDTSGSVPPNPGDTGDGDGDGGWEGDGDGDPCGSLGFMMAPCNGEFLGCLDGWTCHFYDATDIYGVSPVGNCSPPCETDLDCEYGVGSDVCVDADIICAAYGPQDIKRCILPCETDADCFPSQFCAQDLGMCLSNST